MRRLLYSTVNIVGFVAGLYTVYVGVRRWKETGFALFSSAGLRSSPLVLIDFSVALVLYAAWNLYDSRN